MRKLFFLIAALTLSVGLWAETFNNIEYIDANGKEQTANGVTLIEPTTTTLNDGWYVAGRELSLNTLVCIGNVHLILADGIKLTTTGTTDHTNDIYTPGIQVSGEGNSLTIYGQTNQLGQLEAKGGEFAAGIGGGNKGSGSNITINGGIVTANGGKHGAGIGGGESGSGFNITINGGTVTTNGDGYGAGIGGGFLGSCSNITINGGFVTANGGDLGAAGIGSGSGDQGSIASNIFVATKCVVKAHNSYPLLIIANTGADLASELAGKRYVFIEPMPLEDVKANAIAAIKAAATDAKAEIDAASSYTAADAIKAQYKGEIEDAVSTGTAEINAAPTVADVDAKRSIYTLKIENIVAAAKEAIKAITKLEQHRAKVISEIENARLHNLLPELDEEQQGYVNETIDDAVNAVNAATTTTEMDKAEAKIFFILSLYPAGKAAAFGEMATPCDNCPAVEISDEETTITLYSPKQVKFKQTQAEE